MCLLDPLPCILLRRSFQSFQSSQSISDGLGDASANIYALAGEGVATMYNPGSDGDGDGWVGSLQYFEGKKGYWLVATNDFTFSYNGTASGLTRSEKNEDFEFILNNFFKYNNS